MAKREIPLFIIDTARAHKKGDCDFLVCTDIESGFIAKADYIDGEREEIGDDYRISYVNGGISLKIQIQRMTGANPQVSSIRTLLKKGMEYFVKIVSVPCNVEHPSKKECADFVGLLIRGNRKNLDEAGADYNERRTVEASLAMLQATKDYLQE